MKWPSILQFESTLDGSLRLLVVTVAAVVLVSYSTRFEVEYSPKLIDLYLFPWWRILTAILLLAAALWCPRVAMLVGLVIVLYLSDMHTLLTPFATTVKAN